MLEEFNQLMEQDPDISRFLLHHILKKNILAWTGENRIITALVKLLTINASWCLTMMSVVCQYTKFSILNSNLTLGLRDVDC